MKLLKRKQEMEKYAKLHKLEASRNYGYEDEDEDEDDNINNNKIKLANQIYNNFSDNTDMNNMKDIVLKCMTTKQMKKILYGYTMKYHKQPFKETMSLEEFKEQTEKIIEKYQWMGGGYYIEDSEWNVYTYPMEGSREEPTYTIKDNQILFENSVHKLNADDNDTVNYMDRLVSILNNLSSNIEVEYEFYNDDEIKDIIWILLWGTDTNIEEEDEPNIY